MELEAVVQLVTVLAAALAIVWHQQHNTDKLRQDFNTAHHQFRQDLNRFREDSNAAHNQLRQDLNRFREDLNAAHHQLREGINENGQRLTRIEGFPVTSIPTVADESIDTASK